MLVTKGPKDTPLVAHHMANNRKKCTVSTELILWQHNMGNM